MNPQNITVNANDLDNLICTVCECPVAIELFQLKILPALYSRQGKEEIIKLPVGHCCKNCGEPMGRRKEEPTLEVVQ
jgi:hypothetical protein